MCLAIPLKVVKIKDNLAVVQSDEYTHQVDLSLVKDVKVGDFLIVKGDLAINKVEKQEAEKIINLVSALNK